MSTHVKNSSPAVMRSFAGSLLLLVVSLIAFFIVVTRQNERADVPVIKDDVVAALKASRRQSIRPVLPKVVERTREASPTMPRRVAPDEVRTQQAATGLFDTVPQGPRDADMQRAIDLIDEGRPEQAVMVLEDMLKLDPRNESALVELAMIHLLDIKQPDIALGYLQRVMDVNPQNQVALSELVSLYEEQDRSEEGLQFLMEVNAKNPDAPDLSYGIGQLLSVQGRNAEALAYLEKATASPDNAVRAYRDLAEAYSRVGDSERSIAAFDQAIASQEGDIQEKLARGIPAAFDQERLNYTKLAKVRELMLRGQSDAAQRMLDDVAPAMSDDESFTVLQEQLYRQRRRG